MLQLLVIYVYIICNCIVSLFIHVKKKYVFNISIICCPCINMGNLCTLSFVKFKHVYWHIHYIAAYNCTCYMVKFFECVIFSIPTHYGMMSISVSYFILILLATHCWWIVKYLIIYLGKLYKWFTVIWLFSATTLYFYHIYYIIFSIIKVTHALHVSVIDKFVAHVRV